MPETSNTTTATGQLESTQPPSSESALRHAAMASAVLAIVKGAAFAVTGSLLVLASMLDSVVDFLVSVTNLKIHQFSRHDADQEHPFGHGGFEVVGSLIQGIILTFTGAGIILESVRRIGEKNHDLLSSTDIIIGAATLVFSAIGGFLIQSSLSRKLKDTDHLQERSLVLLADNAHYLGDVYSNLLAACGLGIVYLTGIGAFDPIFAGISGIFLVKTAYPIIKKCFYDIVHQEVDPKLQRQIAEIVLRYNHSITGIHHLRTRELGPHLFIDFHLSVRGEISLKEAHEISEEVEGAIKSVIPRADVMIHLDPDSDDDHNDWFLQDSIVVCKLRTSDSLL